MLTLLPKQNDSEEGDSGNLELGKGIDSYIKVSQSVITDEISRPQPKNIIKN